MNHKHKTVVLAKMGMLVAISIVLVAIIHFPIFPMVAFMEYDPADIPILIGTFAFGPVAGLILTAVTSVIQGVTVSAASGVYGIIMHVIATGVLVIVAGVIYKFNKTRKGAVIALIAGVLAMTVAMMGANMIIILVTVTAININGTIIIFFVIFISFSKILKITKFPPLD